MKSRMLLSNDDQGKPSGEGEESNPLHNPKASFKERALVWMFAFSQFVQMRTQPLLARMDLALLRNILLVLAVSFVIASSLSTLVANAALNFAFGPKKTNASDVSFSGPVEVRSEISGSEMKKNILTRNLFNLLGTLAPDEGGDNKVTRTSDLDFSQVPCTNEPMPVEVVGTLFTGDPAKSFVSVKDAKVEDADIYKAGDLVIEHEDYEVYRVYRGRVEFRKGDQKICVSIKGMEDESGQASPAAAPGVVAPENVETMEFDSAFMTAEIGPGYANILNAAKLIPELDDGKMIGFKLLTIVPGSLFDRMKFQNGDIVADVNGVSMRDPSQGFKLYQALQEEREIEIKLIRGGQPMIRKVRVK